MNRFLHIIHSLLVDFVHSLLGITHHLLVLFQIVQNVGVNRLEGRFGGTVDGENAILTRQERAVSIYSAWWLRIYLC
jgi:hypothetical protein